MQVVPYEKVRKDEWNAFVAASKNGTFLFDRNYMDYHADRFQDSSLMVYSERGKLIGVFPASRKGDVVTSHGGLTYGGVVCDLDMKAAMMLWVFDRMLDHLAAAGVKKLVYKPVPHVLHQYPAEEDLYALFRRDAKLVRRDASFAIWLPEKLKFAKGKREGVRKANRAGLVVRESADFEAFFEIGREVMRVRHQGQPAHTACEMALLASRFPLNIKMHAAYDGNRMLAGAISYGMPHAAHVQYMYSCDDGLTVGALDLVIERLVESCTGKRFINFGISTEDNGRFLNEGLAHQKEMFGARCVIQEVYEVDLT